MKKAFKIVMDIITLLLFVILVLNIYSKAKQIVTGKDYSSLFGYTSFQIASGSMEPELSINDIVVVNTNYGELQTGDIISFKSGKSIVTHRIVTIDGEQITAKGDSNNVLDDPISKEDVIGKVVKVYPNLSVWKDIITSPKIIILIFITLILFDFAISYKGTKPKEKLEVEPQIEKTKKIKARPIQKNEEDVIEKNDLLDLTRSISLSEIDEVLNAVETTTDEEEEEKTFEEEPEIEDENEYTIRLDLKSIDELIRKKAKEEQDKNAAIAKEIFEEEPNLDEFSEIEKNAAVEEVKTEETSKETTKKVIIEEVKVEETQKENIKEKETKKERKPRTKSISTSLTKKIRKPRVRKTTPAEEVKIEKERKPRVKKVVVVNEETKKNKKPRIKKTNLVEKTTTSKKTRIKKNTPVVEEKIVRKPRTKKTTIEKETVTTSTRKPRTKKNKEA